MIPINAQIHLEKFKLRPYQIPLARALEIDKKRRLLVVWPRRAGKDAVSFYLIIRQAIMNIGVYFMVYP